MAMGWKLLSALPLALVAGAVFGAMAMSRELKPAGAGAGAMAEVPRFKLFPDSTIDHKVGKANNIPDEANNNARKAKQANHLTVDSKSKQQLQQRVVDLYSLGKANNIPDEANNNARKAKHANLTVESKLKQPRVVVQDLYSHGEGFNVQIRFNGRLVHQLRVTEDGGIQDPKEARILNLTAKVQELVDECKRNKDMYHRKSADLDALESKSRIELISAIIAGSLLVLDVIHRMMTCGRDKVAAEPQAQPANVNNIQQNAYTMHPMYPPAHPMHPMHPPHQNAYPLPPPNQPAVQMPNQDGVDAP